MPMFEYIAVKVFNPILHYFTRGFERIGNTIHRRLDKSKFWNEYIERRVGYKE